MLSKYVIIILFTLFVIFIITTYSIVIVKWSNDSNPSSASVRLDTMKVVAIRKKTTVVGYVRSREKSYWATRVLNFVRDDLTEKQYHWQMCMTGLNEDKLLEKSIPYRVEKNV